MAKIQKSFRLSEDVVLFIESQKGSTLNEKFENLVYMFKKEEKAKRAKVATLDAEIINKISQINAFAKDIEKLRRVKQGLICLDNEVENLLKTIKKC